MKKKYLAPITERMQVETSCILSGSVIVVPGESEGSNGGAPSSPW